MDRVKYTEVRADRELREEVLVKLIELSEEEGGIHRSDLSIFHCRTVEGIPTSEQVVYRMDVAKNWEWRTDELSQMVRTLIDPFVHYYVKVTRVMCIAQIPGVALDTHVDHIAGQYYDYGMNLGSHTTPDAMIELFRDGKLQADPHLHEKQRYYGGRLFLQDENSSYYVEDGEKFYYHPENRFFFLRDAFEHGSDAQAAWRGFLYIDGMFRPDMMESIYDDQ